MAQRGTESVALEIDRETFKRATAYARAHGTTLGSLFESFFARYARDHSLGDTPTRIATGSVRAGGSVTNTSVDRSTTINVGDILSNNTFQFLNGVRLFLWPTGGGVADWARLVIAAVSGAIASVLWLASIS